MSRPIVRNSTSNIARVRVFDEDALPWLGLAHDAPGLQIWYTPLGGSPVQITLDVDKWRETPHGWYEVKVPDGAYAGTAPLQFSGEITGGTVEGEEHVIVGYDPLAEAVGAGAAVLDAAAENPIAADVRRVAGEVQSVATEESVQAVLGAVSTMTAEAIRIPSPNVKGNLQLVAGDTYDGIANAKPSWIVANDYTNGWSVMMTIRTEEDGIVLESAGEVESDTLVSVSLTAPSGVPFVGCPGVWQGKYDVQLSKGESRKTIAVGKCYVTEDQTR